MRTPEDTWWTADEAIVWLVFGRRDENIVWLPDILVKTEPGEKHWARAPENVDNAARLRNATDELIASFRSERVSCFGVRTGNQSDGYQRIRPEHWLSALTIHRNAMAADSEGPMEEYVAASRRPRYEDLRLRATEVMALRAPATTAAATVEPKTGKVRRDPKRVDFAQSDAPLVVEMDKLIQSRKATSAYNAALMVVDRALGTRNAVSKAKRLLKRYSDVFRAEHH